MKTISDNDFQLVQDDFAYNYQKMLTENLDSLNSNFDQSTINEIVLWKVNRYSKISQETFELLNKIKKDDNYINISLTQEILVKLINGQGIQLPMASTILRFKNPKIYQIIDQRVYRILYGKMLKLPTYKTESNINSQIGIYLEYLKDLRVTADKLRIPFEKADRILYEADKRLNKEENLKNY